jgi:predicted O-methyltransferase YrrM
MPDHTKLTPPDLRSVDGFLSEEEAAGLFRLACQVGDGVLEVGTYCGRSTIALATGRKACGKSPVYAVDHGQGSVEHRGHLQPGGTWPIALANFERFEVTDHVIPIQTSSVKASVQLEALRWSLVFLDGAHQRVDVLTDALLWLPRILPGGMVAFHDFGPSGNLNVVPAVKSLQCLLNLDQVDQFGSIGVFAVDPGTWV